jgi:hypothetical protein
VPVFKIENWKLRNRNSKEVNCRVCGKLPFAVEHEPQIEDENENEDEDDSTKAATKVSTKVHGRDGH